ncbi:MAG: hypothetical protein VYD87_10060 [Pseudomonadota bacterium]|nr:hypothetical protein [Pseudomonadota bacterium]
MSTSKYAPLESHLKASKLNEIRMTFSEIERLLGFPLPNSARRHRPWWSNSTTSSTITQHWLNAGYYTSQVDMAGEKLVFVRTSPPDVAPAAPASNAPSDGAKSPARPARHPIFGALAGMFRLAPGVDLTEPAEPRWARIAGIERDGPAEAAESPAPFRRPE